MVEALDDENVQTVPAQAPGRLLRAARERKGLSLQDAADSLNLMRGIIEAIEADRYDLLPPRTFLKGYLRSYARLVEIKEYDVLAAFELQHPEPGPESIQLALPRDRTQPRGHWLKWLVLLLALVLLSYAAYQGYVLRGEPDTAAATVGDDEVALPQESAANEAPLPESEVVAAVQAPAAPVDSGQPAEQRLPEEQSPAVEQAVVAPVAPVPAPAAAPVQAEARAQAPAAEAMLVIEVAGESWVQITDAAGAAVHSALVQGPRTLNISGKPPFRLTIGNAEAVVVRYDGKPVPLAPYIRRDVARLTVPLSR
ncbi:MAG TPA: RodZ domain-containing protein [Gammaproteobacteria bacterium]|nr:RodZ domain-containing protein [Gammaproteobacteria bacterium]